MSTGGSNSDGEAFAAIIFVGILVIMGSVLLLSQNIGASFSVTLHAVFYSVLGFVPAGCLFALYHISGDSFSASKVGAILSLLCALVWRCWWSVFASISCKGCDPDATLDAFHSESIGSVGVFSGDSFLDNWRVEYGVEGFLIASCLFCLYSASQD